MLENIWIYIIIGFFAQIVDGCLGMAYGVLSTTLLTSMGVSVINASASVHFSEIFTTFTSGISHCAFKNIDKTILYKLILPGVIGGIIGAYLLSNIDAYFIKPFVNTYLLILGLYILYKSVQNIKIKPTLKRIETLGFVGGLLDAIGGGGWGPIVTATLVSQGNTPNKTVGSVNASEFFVTLAQSVTFFICIGSFVQYYKIILGLLIGGILAAPIAAYSCKKINVKSMKILIGILIVLTNIFALLKYFKLF